MFRSIQFHSLLLFVSQCLGKYDVAKNVKRYPVLCGGHFQVPSYALNIHCAVITLSMARNFFQRLLAVYADHQFVAIVVGNIYVKVLTYKKPVNHLQRGKEYPATVYNEN